MNRIIEVIHNADMRNGLNGLFRIAKKHGAHPENLKKGEFLVFINTKESMFRVYVSGTTFAHFKPESGRVDKRMIQHLPEAFNGTSFEWNNALKKAILKENVQ